MRPEAFSMVIFGQVGEGLTRFVGDMTTYPTGRRLQQALTGGPPSVVLDGRCRLACHFCQVLQRLVLSLGKRANIPNCKHGKGFPPGCNHPPPEWLTLP